MKTVLKTPLVAACAAAMLAAGSAAVAGGDGRHHGGHYGGHHGKYSHYQYPRHYQPRRHYKRHRHNDDDELFVGLLLGGLVGYALGNAQPEARRYESYPPVSAPPPQVSYPAPQPVYGDSGAGTCLQEREYQTRVMIGGQQVDAYGTACLQPDGSWRRGPARAAAY